MMRLSFLSSLNLSGFDKGLWWFYGSAIRRLMLCPKKLQFFQDISVCDTFARIIESRRVD